MFNAIRNLLVFGVVAASIADAGEFLIVTRSANGAWSFRDAETVSVNGKEKLRSSPLSDGPIANWDSKAIGKLGEVQLSNLALLRRTKDGLILGRSGESASWQLLFAEGANAKVAQSPAQLWSTAAITFKADRKEKTGTSVNLEELYAIVPGRDAGASAAMLATDLGSHKTPGMTDAQAFQQMLAMLPAAAEAFRNTPASATIHAFLISSLRDHIKTWQEGDASIAVLDDSLAFATAAEKAFPGDAPLGQLVTGARSIRKALDRRVAILRALNAGKQSDSFLVAYRDFEVFDKSFAELSKFRLEHMRASALMHLQSAQTLEANGDYLGAIRHLLIAKWRDPKLKAVDEQLETVRLEAARLSAQKFAEIRRGIDPRSPAQVQLQRRLLLAEQQMNDEKTADAEKTLHDAESMDKDEPRLTLLQARLSVARGDLGKALAQLDNFDGIAVTAQDFAEGEKLRASVQYKIDTSLNSKRSQIETDLGQQRFAAALESSAEGLKLDNESPEFLYFAAVNSCILRHCGTAEPMLRRFLEVTDSSDGNRLRRLSAMQLLQDALAMRQEQNANQGEGTQASWFSGARLDRGVYYDPVSLSFQPRVSRIEASDHLSVAYDWNAGQLRSVHVKHEEKQTGGNIARLAGAAVASAAGISTTVGWKTAARETNDFFFNYYEDAPQILKVSRENARVESRRIPISIPGIGMFGPFAGIGALGALSNIGSIGALAKMGGGLGALGGGFPGLSGGLSGMGSLGLSGGIAGAGNSAILSRLAGAGRMSGISGFNSLMPTKPRAPSQNYSVMSDPQGGSSEGYLTLWNGPRVDTRLAFKVTGKRAAVGFSGNRYFHPFGWDGIHLFELDYDDQGRVAHAWELDSPAAPRLDFTWDHQRLMKVAARDDAGRVVYSRNLNYSGDRLVSESINGQGGASHIEYKYDKQSRLTEAVLDTDKSLDGQSRKVFFAETDKEKH